MDFTNKVVLVTGSSRGLGRELIKEFAKYKANVIINYNKSEKEAISLQQEIEKYNIKSIIIKADISNEIEVKNMIKVIINKFGFIDILINNASIAKDNDILKKSVAEFKSVIDTNLVGTFIVTKEVSKFMYVRKQGKIINITSTNGIDTNYPESVDYDVSKAGIISLTHNFAIKLAPYINVFAVALGWMNTEMNKDMEPNFKKAEQDKILLHRFAEPQEIAKTIVFLASDNANYINNTVIRIDGGTK